MRHYDALAAITDVLLDEATGPDRLHDALDHYRDILLSASGIDLGEEDSLAYLDTGAGVAIGPTWAALCVDDQLRTKRFVSGLHRAIQDVAARRTDGPVHVLYAGTGPFATLAIPLMTRFTPQELQFTCLEITDGSYRAVRRLFSELGVQAYVRNTIQTDAATYRIDEALPVDILLSETMQYCLREEMQVPIMLNLMAQLPPDTIMIPERITLLLASLADDEEQAIDTELGTVFTLDRESLRNYRPQLGTTDFPTVHLAVPVTTADTGPLAIRTLIQVYAGYGLTDYESGLTIPNIIGDCSCAGDPGYAMEFTYQLHPSPGLLVGP